jgi:hypothetical protein
LTTDPEARLMRKGQEREAKLSYHGHVLMEKRPDMIIRMPSQLEKASQQHEQSTRGGRESAP